MKAGQHNNIEVSVTARIIRPQAAEYAGPSRFAADAGFLPETLLELILVVLKQLWRK
jgi:hypothetical protein